MEDQHLRVIEEEDGSLLIEWDEDHPFAEIFASWTEEQWVESIRLGYERAAAEKNG